MPNSGFLPISVAQGGNGVGQRLGVAGAVGKENAIGLSRQDILSGGGAGKDGDPAPDLDETARDVPLHAEVKGYHVARDRAGRKQLAAKSACETLVPFPRSGRNDLANQIAPNNAWPRAGLVDQRAVIQVDGRQNAGHGAADPQAANQGAGVDALDAGDVVPLQVRSKVAAGAKVARNAVELADNEALHLRMGRLFIFRVDAVVADQRISHGDDLSLVGRIGQDLLVAGHAGVENDFAEGFVVRSKAAAGEDCSIFQSEFGGRLSPWRGFSLAAFEGQATTVQSNAAPRWRRLPAKNWASRSRTRAESIA